MIGELSDLKRKEGEVASVGTSEEERRKKLRELAQREGNESNPEQENPPVSGQEKIHQVELAARESEAKVVQIVGEGNEQNPRFLEKAQKLGISRDVVAEVLESESENIHRLSEGRKTTEGTGKKNIAKLMTFVLGVGGAGVPGTAKAVEMGMGMGAENTMKRIAEGVPENPILKKMLKEKTAKKTQIDAKRIGIVADAEEGGDGSARALADRLKEQTEALKQKIAEETDGKNMNEKEAEVEHRQTLFDVEQIDSGIVDGLAGITDPQFRKDCISFLGKNPASIPEDLARHNRNAMGSLVKTYGESSVKETLSLLREISPLADESEKLSSYSFGFSYKGGEDGGSKYEKVDRQFQNLATLIENPEFAKSLKTVVGKIRQSGDRMNFPLEDMKPAFIDLLGNDPNELAAFLEFRAESKKSFLPVKFLKWLEENKPYEADQSRYGKLGYKPTEIMGMYQEWQKKENESASGQ